MKKQKRSVNTRVMPLLLGTLALNTYAGIFDACFGGGEYKPITEQKLQARMSKIPDSFGVCFNKALCLAKVERLLTQADEDVVVAATKTDLTKSTNYTPEYKSLMNLNDDGLLHTSLNNSNAINNLNLGDIHDSGFINFKRLNGDKAFFHTVYVQVSASGEKFLYSANDASLARSIMQAGNDELVQVGGSLRFKMDENTVTGFNRYLTNHEAGEIGFVYTPANQVADNIAHFGNGV
ncbi:hypothetical protein [Thalassomonas sp. RHCl1]|uniref:hypothetical protein n=1 Tax=Thalassomonas sp. RHCl1 TaxID=2995320 RepID=UPI00248C8129|nr:hypothetical protein [Thalassomonas sp. RHCl1]